MTFTMARRVVTTAIGAAGLYLMSRQCRRPTGWLGQRVAAGMNLSHASLTAWGLGHVHIEPGWSVLDVGCGGGRTVRSMAAMAASGRVEGVDYAPASLAVARQTNADLIAAGRVAVQEGTVSHLPFPDEAFDLVTAVETHYYWPDLLNDLRETRRVLKPGGRLLIVAEAYSGRRMDWLYAPAMRLLLRATYLSVDEHRAALIAAGFDAVEVDTDRSHGWLAAVGVRPA